MSRTKKIGFILCAILLTYVLAELISFTFYAVTEGAFFSFSQHQASRLAIIDAITSNRPPTGKIPIPSINAEVIHPYLGFVLNPEEMEGISEYGFLGQRASPISVNTEKNLIIGIFGGSFADNTSRYAQDEILHELRQLPAFSDKEMIVHTIAMGGYKQPQQLLALTYFLSLSAHFDIVINLDGFNEVTLAQAENANVIFPFYPRGWAARVGNIVDTEKLTLIAEISFFDEKMRTWANVLATTPLRYTITANLLWRRYHLKLYNERQRKAQALEQHAVKRKEELGYIATGPSFPYNSEAEMFQQLANVWKICSLQMHKLCAANGIVYVHFLQPNQYVPDSKIMKEEELKRAFREDHPYRKGVVQGYPLLIQAGKALQDEGVNFRDLTMLFADRAELLYSDDCCHLNQQGYSMIGTAIGETLVEHFK